MILNFFLKIHQKSSFTFFKNSQIFILQNYINNIVVNRYLLTILFMEDLYMFHSQEKDSVVFQKPEIGKGATIYDSNNKFAYEVLDINEIGDTIVLKRYIPTRVDSGSPFSKNQVYEFKNLAFNHIIIKKMEGVWKIENRYTKRWDYIQIAFGIKEEYNGKVA